MMQARVNLITADLVAEERRELRRRRLAGVFSR